MLHARASNMVLARICPLARRRTCVDARQTYLQLENRASVAAGVADDIQHPERFVCRARHEDPGVTRVHSHLIASTFRWFLYITTSCCRKCLPFPGVWSLPRKRAHIARLCPSLAFPFYSRLAAQWFDSDQRIGGIWGYVNDILAAAVSICQGKPMSGQANAIIPQ